MGAVAVVVSLLYVGTQLHQANKQLQRQENNATESEWQSIRLLMASDRGVAQLWLAGLDDKLPDAVDQLRFQNLMSEHFWVTFHIWDRVRLGIFAPGDFWNGAAMPLAQWLCTPGGEAWWSQRKATYPITFVHDMDTTMRRFASSSKVHCPAHAGG